MMALKIKRLLQVFNKLQKNYFLTGLFIFFTITAGFICFYKLGNSYFENFDEGIYAQIVKEMLRSKDYTVLHWGGKLSLDKTPLNFWLDSLFSLIFGLSEFSIRLTSAISGFVVVLAVTIYSFKNWGKLASFLTFVTIVLNNLYIWRVRTANLDALLSLLVAISFFLMISKNKFRYILLGVTFGLIFLQKSTVVVFPLFVFILTELLFNYRNLLKNVGNYILFGIILCGIAGIWLMLGQHSSGNPLFASYYLFRSDQGVAHLDLSKFKFDYLMYAYYSLQRRFTYLFVVGIVLLATRIYKRRELTILLFSVFLIFTLSFTERKNNWYLIPSMPFWAITIGYATDRLVKFFSRFLHPVVISIFILIPTLYISYKTFTINIMSIINGQPNMTEVKSAQIIKKLSREKDVIMRLDHAYPVTLFYADRKTHYYDHVDMSLYEVIKDLDVNWVVGKTIIVEEFLKNPEIKPLQIIKNGDETIVSFSLLRTKKL